MAASVEGAVSPKTSENKKTPEEAVAGHNLLRLEQRQIATKIFELESDLAEHRLVIDNLKKVEESRKCYRLIGGVLTEGVVKDVLPSLETNSEQLKTAIEGLNQRLIAKGKEALAGQS